MRGWKPLTLLLVLAFALATTGCSLLPESDDSGDDETTTSSEEGEAGPATVTLSWDENVDLDLEIWDEEGLEALVAAFTFGADDVTDGSGDEVFEFVRYEDAQPPNDFSNGTFVVSVFFGDQPEGSDIEEVEATLTVAAVDGSTETTTGLVYFAADQDNWHVWSIDAATGETAPLNQYH